MNPEIIVGGLSLLGTLFGSFAGIMTANKLTNYRIAQLEKKVDMHNNFAARMPVLEEKIAVANNRIKDLEEART